MSKPADWARPANGQLVTVARNVSARYLAILTEVAVGVVMLPFNLAHLGKAEYGLWMLMGSLTVHFSTLDLGYGSGLVKFVAHYRAHRDARALNEIASTLFCVFGGIALIAYLIVVAVAMNLEHLFPLSANQAATGRAVLLIIGAYVALNFPFSVYGGIVSGFQRYDVNSRMTIFTLVAVGLVNAAVLQAGYGLVPLVCATTGVRVLGYFVYSRNAYKVFPELRIRPSLFRRARLAEVTSFSIYAAIIDWANKLNYQLDQIVIGAFLGSSAVAVWAPAERITIGVQRMTNQLNGVLFPMIVDNDALQQRQRLQEILLQGTRLSLAMVVPIAVALITLADPLVHAWLRGQAASVAGCIPVIQILAVAVTVRVGNATGNTLLKAAGQHRKLAWTNLGAGVVNLALSVILIRRFGLTGVAWGTLVPIASAALFILYPTACRHVGLPLRRAAIEAVFPALWPGFVAGGVLMLIRDISSGTLLAVAVQAALGGVIYLTLFYAVAISRQDRKWYLAKAAQLTGRRSLAPAGSA